MDEIWDDVTGRAHTFWQKCKEFFVEDVWPKMEYILLNLLEAVLEAIPETVSCIFTFIQMFGTIFGMFIAATFLIICALVVFFGIHMVYEMLKGIFYVVNKLISTAGSVANAGASVLNKADHLFGGHSHMHVHIPKLDPCSILPGLCDALHLPQYCAPYQSYSGAFGLFFKIVLSEHTCPLIRWTFFTVNDAISLYKALEFFIGFTSYNPDPNGNNCHSTKYAEPCFYILIGYFIMALVIVAIVGVIVSSYRHTIWKLIKTAVMFAWWVVKFVFELFLDCGKWFVTKIDRYEQHHGPPPLSAMDRVFLRHISKTIRNQL